MDTAQRKNIYILADEHLFNLFLLGFHMKFLWGQEKKKFLFFNEGKLLYPLYN